MGLYLTNLSCKISSKDKIIVAMDKIMLSKGLILISKKIVNETSGKPNQYEITDEINGWIQIFCPEQINDEFALDLSKQLNIMLIQFDIIDGAYWMYQVYDSGKLIDKFNSWPDYWKGVDNKEKLLWQGNSKILAKVFKISEAQLSPYLKSWNDKILNDKNKAFPSDEFSIKEPWVFVDFQKKLGITYPDFENPNNKVERLCYGPKKTNKILQLFKK